MQYQFALIGCGRIAARHAAEITRVGKLAAVCDSVPEKAESFAATYGANAYTTLDELLKAEPQVEIVVVCTPNGYHAEHAIKALQARRHVLCEKPMSITLSAAWQMSDTAHFFRRRLFVVKQNRYNGPVQLVRQLLEDGKLGRVYNFQLNGFWERPQEYYTGDWRGSTELDGGILHTQFSHFIDLVYWLLGDVEEVKALGTKASDKQHLQYADTVVAAMRMKSGVLGGLHFTVNSFGHNREGSLTLFAEKGTVRIGGQYLNTLEWLDGEGLETHAATETRAANEYGFYTGSMSNHHRVYDEIVLALEGRQATLAEGSDAVKTIEIIEKIQAALNPQPA